MSNRIRERAPKLGARGWCAVGVLALAACSSDSPARRGELVIVIDTDMAVPKDLTDVRIQVHFRKETQLDKTFAIPAESRLPGTMAIRGGSDPLDAVSVEVTGLRVEGKTREARTFAKLVTTIPPDRVAMYHMPIQWLCDRNTCAPLGGKERACRAGSCELVEVEASELPEYNPTEIFGGGESAAAADARCFETLACFAGQRDVLPDPSDCRIPAPGTRERVNVALRFPSTADSPGMCADTEKDQACYVPLDRDELYGWSFTDDGKIQLPEAVCTRLKDGEVFVVRVSTACATKTSRTPTCGPWSAVHTPVSPESQAGTSGAASGGGSGIIPSGGGSGMEAGPEKGGSPSFAGSSGTAGATSTGGSVAVGGRGGGGATSAGGPSFAGSVGRPVVEPFCGKRLLPGKVDDLDDGNTAIVAPYLGYWYSFKEDGAATLSPSPFVVSAGGAIDGGYAACSSGRNFTTWGAAVGFGLAQDAVYKPCAVDGSGVSGVSFWVRGTGTGAFTLRLNVATTETSEPRFGGTCDLATTACGFHAFAYVPPAPTGRRVNIPFNSLKEGAVAIFNPRHILDIHFAAGSTAFDGENPVSPYSFDYCIDDVQFY